MMDSKLDGNRFVPAAAAQDEKDSLENSYSMAPKQLAVNYHVSTEEMIENDSAAEESAENSPCTGNDEAEDVNVAPTEDSVEKATREPWELLFFLCAVNTLIGINVFFFALYYVELVRYFNVSTADVGWPNSLHQGVTMFFGIVVSAPVKLYGTRIVGMLGGIILSIGMTLSFFVDSIMMLCLTYGLIAGTGVSMVYLSATVTLHQNFHKNRTLATGIAMCGLNLGNVIGPLWVNYLLETFGWRGGFLIHGGVLLHTVALASQYHQRRSSFPESRGIRAILRGSVDFSLFKNPSFVMFCLGLFGHKTCQYAAWSIVANFVVVSGGTTKDAALILSILGGALLVSRLVGGFLVNLGCVNRVLVLGVTVILGGVTVMLLAVSDSYLSVAILSGLYGLNMGLGNTLVTVALAEVLGVRKIARSTALANSVQGISAFFSPPFAGWLFDVTGQYDATFLISGTFSVLGGFLYLLVLLTERCKPSQDLSQDHDL